MLEKEACKKALKNIKYEEGVVIGSYIGILEKNNRDLTNKLQLLNEEIKENESNCIKLGSAQAEMIYLSMLLTLREIKVDIPEKHERLSNLVLERHEAIHLEDLLDIFYNFFVEENEFASELELN